LAYTTPSTIAAAQLVTSSLMNTEWVENIKFLANPPSCRVYHNAAQSITNNSVAVCSFNSERWDTDSMHSTSVNTSRITINTAGLYIVTFHIEFESASNYTNTAAVIKMNGTTDLGQQYRVEGNGVTIVPRHSVATVYKFSAGNYVEGLVFQINAGGSARNLTSTAQFSPEMTATWIGFG
jgi:hypothetical protein